MNNIGWVPYELRTKEGKYLTDEFHERIGSFGSLNNASVDIPEKQIFAEYELDINGELLPRILQRTGSCVGCGGETAYGKTRLADIVFREDTDVLKVGFPFATYGIGRRKGGMRGPGEGSFGSVQAWAADPENFGYVPWDHPLVPQPKVKGAWWSWDARVEKQWSHPSVWPHAESKLAKDAKEFGIGSTTRIKDIEEADRSIALGYPMTIASMFGTRDRVEHGVCLGRWNDRWAHQMSVPPTIWNHPDLGWIYQVDNQWGPRAHKTCPVLSEFGVDGSFWILQKDFEKIIKSGEVYAHTSANNFEGSTPVVEWTMGMNFDKE